MGDFKVAVSPGAFGVNDALWDAFAVEMGEEVTAKVAVRIRLEQRGSRSSYMCAKSESINGPFLPTRWAASVPQICEPGGG